MDHRITQIIEWMHERLHTQTSIDSLAAEVGLSTSRLGFLFRLETGASPGAYLHSLRMERARLLIESTSLAVAEVMRQVGLSDPSHFARDFRNAYGLSPRAYRLQLKLAGPPVRYANGTHTATHITDDVQAKRPTGPGAARSGAVTNDLRRTRRPHENNDETPDDHHRAPLHDGDGRDAICRRRCPTTDA